MFPTSANGALGIIPYVMAGFPDQPRSVAAARSFASLGIAALELGIPFSDPLADGPVIQAAGHAALAAGMTVARCLEVAAQVSGTVPVVFMSYINPILAYGPDRFAADCSSAGVAGVILPDLPPEEAGAVAASFHSREVATIFLVAPTSSPERIARICAASSGFVYCVTVTGVTGFRAELPPGVGALLDSVRASTALPIAAGFGISRPAHLAPLRGHADAAVVATAVVNEQAGGRDPSRLVEELVRACL